MTGKWISTRDYHHHQHQPPTTTIATASSPHNKDQQTNERTRWCLRICQTRARNTDRRRWLHHHHPQSSLQTRTTPDQTNSEGETKDPVYWHSVNNCNPLASSTTWTTINLTTALQRPRQRTPPLLLYSHPHPATHCPAPTQSEGILWGLCIEIWRGIRA